jgi:hypothetical protein
MGCDIHLVVEKRNGNQWERVLPPDEVRDPWLVEQSAQETGESRWYRDRVKVTWFDDRNYNLFAILAGVRNNFDFEPISEPRGLPNDLSAEVRKLVEYGDEEEDALDAEVIAEEAEDDNDVSLGDHSQSWLTLRELLDCNWDREIKEGGWVDAWNFELWRKHGKPNAWAGGVGGGRVEHISYREMARKIDSGDIQWEGDEPKEGSWDHRTYTTSISRMLRQAQVPKGSVGEAIAETRYFTYVEWPLTYKEAAGRFYKQILPALQKLGKPEDVRIVFGFDS